MIVSKNERAGVSVLNELLSAEARIDGHEHDEVEVGNDFLEHADGGVGNTLWIDNVKLIM